MVALAWSAYWFYLSDRYRNAILDQIQPLSSAGIQVEFADLHVRGFPNRIDLTATEVTVSSDDLVWRLPFFQILSLSYRPHQAILVFPPSQAIEHLGTTVFINSEAMRASLNTSLSSGWPLEQLVVEAESISIGEDSVWREEFGRTVLALRLISSDSSNYDLAFHSEAQEVSRPAEHWPARIVQTVATAKIMSRVSMHAPITLDICHHGRQGIVSVDIHEASARILGAEVRSKGLITFEENGRPKGELDVELGNWEDLFDTVFRDRQGRKYEFIKLMATAVGSFRTTLEFKDEKITLAGLPVADSIQIQPFCSTSG